MKRELKFNDARVQRERDGFYLCLRLLPGHESTAYSLLDEMQPDKDGKIPVFDATCKNHREGRSLSANALCWVLCEKIAVAASTRKAHLTKEDVYREAVKRVGPFQVVTVETKAVDELLRHWNANGTGWIGENLGVTWPNGSSDVILYYGSHSYNTDEMSRLIDDLIEDAQALGIETQPPEEIDRIKSLWQDDVSFAGA